MLCIQGFRGYGYSKGFVGGMRAVVNRLKEEPDVLVTVIDRRDQICHPCPHLGDEGCLRDGEVSEESRVVHDRRVLSWLGLEVGQKVSWSDVLELIASRVSPDDLAHLCQKCRWMPEGYCRDGIAKSRQAP